MARIVVVGAGVIGLQTAITLLEAGYQVTVIAKHLPGDESIDYTSPWAGAIWRTHSTADQVERCEWDLESYRAWLKIIETDPEQARAMGIQGRPITIYTTKKEVDSTSPSLWFSPHVHNFTILNPEDLPPGCASGYKYDSIAINPPRYLSYLFTKVQALGARIIRAELPTTKSFAHAISTGVSLASAPDVGDHDEDQSIKAVVNCTGIGARALTGDVAVHPIRGQTLLVRPAHPIANTGIFLFEHGAPADIATYIVPRPGTDTFILGGTTQANAWDAEPHADVSNGIMERCRNLWPGLGAADLQVVSTQVGLRPGRRGGVRVEVEDVRLEDGRVVDVVHQYGHAGAGFQLSMGSARKAVGLVQALG